MTRECWIEWNACGTVLLQVLFIGLVLLTPETPGSRDGTIAGKRRNWCWGSWPTLHAFLFVSFAVRRFQCLRPTFDTLLHTSHGTVLPECFYSFLYNYVSSINELLCKVLALLHRPFCSFILFTLSRATMYGSSFNGFRPYCKPYIWQKCPQSLPVSRRWYPHSYSILTWWIRGRLSVI